jgi:hypothetical protein
MPTLYVENVPEDVYEAIRRRARENRTSIAREVLIALKEKFPTAEELKRRRRIFDELARLRATEPPGKGPFPSSEELVREDRER